MQAWQRLLPDGRAVQVRATDRTDGDLRVDGEPALLHERRAAVADRPWVWLRQVHGAGVVVVEPDDDPSRSAGSPADAVVTVRTDVALAVHGADCGIVALWSAEGIVGAAHAGWKGLEAGVLDATAARMRQLGAGSVRAVLGPCIGPECYEFGVEELDRLAGALGESVRGRTASGGPALDLRAAVRAALAAAEVEVVRADPRCTACARGADGGPALFSHRARGDQARQALVVWLEDRVPPEDPVLVEVSDHMRQQISTRSGRGAGEGRR